MSKPIPDVQYYGIGQVAKSLSLSHNTVASILDRGELQYVKIGSRRLISADELGAYLATKTVARVVRPKPVLPSYELPPVARATPPPELPPPVDPNRVNPMLRRCPPRVNPLLQQRPAKTRKGRRT